MHDYIEIQNNIFETIQNIFENNYDDLKDTKDEILNIFKNILTSNAKNYQLLEARDFSVNPVSYYHIVSRVKSKHSFKEKLYRKNIGLQISDDLSLENNIDEKQAIIREKILRIDDIIGLRIVTELKFDCNNVYKLIKEKSEDFEEKGIIFNSNELENQPEVMKNGLHIYRIKGVYNSIYGFELQIKSKIEEAWGEMDHSIFYKDYAVSPIKNAIQVTMNNVGHLLDKIEDLLLGLRNSENNFKEKKEELEFLSLLSHELFIEIKNKLGDNYDLSTIASSIKYLKEKSGYKNTELDTKRISYTFLTYSVENETCKNYIKLRKRNFELIILEAIYWHWKKKANTKFKLTSRNYERSLIGFIEILFNNLCENIKSISKLKFTINIEILKQILTEISNYTNVKSFLLETKIAYQILIIENIITDPINEYFIENEINGDEELSLLIKKIYIATFLNQNLSSFIEQIEIINIDFFQSKEINNCVSKINTSIKNLLNDYKIEEDHTSLKECKFVEIVIQNTLQNLKEIENGN